jgi:hypothetical protein
VDLTHSELFEAVQALGQAEGSRENCAERNAYLTGAKEALEAAYEGRLGEFALDAQGIECLDPLRFLEGLRDDLNLAKRRWGRERHAVAFQLVQSLLEDLKHNRRGV